MLPAVAAVREASALAASKRMASWSWVPLDDAAGEKRLLELDADKYANRSCEIHPIPATESDVPRPRLRTHPGVSMPATTIPAPLQVRSASPSSSLKFYSESPTSSRDF